MASINRTAYPRFRSSLTAHELQALYRPSNEEQLFVTQHARGPAQQLTLLTLLKCHQNLGYTLALTDVPSHIRIYLSQQLHLPANTALEVEAEKTLYRYRHLGRSSWRVESYTLGGAKAIEAIVAQAAYTMSDPADLINVAIEHLVEQRFELPACSTLDRLVGTVRHQVHQHLYAQITQSLLPADIGRLEALLGVQNGRTAFSRIKVTPRGASLQHIRQWSNRLDWLESIVTTRPHVSGIAKTKVQQFAAEAIALDIIDMRRIQIVPRRRALLVCLLHQAQVQTRDQLVEMFLRRMRHTVTLAKEKLTDLQDQHRTLEEHMLAVFAEVIDHAIHTPEDNASLGQGMRDILKNDGGAEALRERYAQVSAYHHQNYRPLMWTIYRPYRAAIFQLSRLLRFRSATHNASLLDALTFIQSYQHTRHDYLLYTISLAFASSRWQALIKSRQNLATVLDRRQLEVCVLHYLAQGLRSGDVYVEGSEAYADYRQQLIPWPACVPRLPAYCQALQLPSSAAAFVSHLQARLRAVTQRVDALFPENTELTIDKDGKPHLTRLKAQPIPEELATLEALLREQMPERHLLDVLKNVHHEITYTRHLGRLPEPILHSLMPSRAIYLPSLVMPANSEPRKPPGMPTTSLAGTL
jgi:hypothetical protein